MADLLDHVGDVGIGRRLTRDKAGLAARLSAVAVDALKKDTMKVQVGVRRRLYLIV
jgi:phenylpyruvate tautomerase PptA (4-oxalocrotonate tautomerase family)